MNRISILLLSVLLTMGAGAAQASGAGLLWKIDGNRASVYLLGVLPFTTQAMYPLPAAIESVFENSSRLLVYVDLLSLEPFAAASTGTELARPEANLTMPDLVSAQTWKRVEAVTTEYQIPQLTFINQEPWFFAWSLNWFVSAVNGYDEARGMDRYLLGRARNRQDMQIIALRTYAEWQGEVDVPGKHEHELLLLASLERIEAGPDYLAGLADAWVQGDAARIADLQRSSLNRAPEAYRLLQRLADRRNAAMLARIKLQLEQADGDTCVLIRAENVIGDKGLPALLKQAGVSVERL